MYKLSLTGATALTGLSVVDGTGPIVLDDLGCENNESRLVDCPHSGLGVHNCRHSEDAGVRCLPLIITSEQERNNNIITCSPVLSSCPFFLHFDRLHTGRH